MKEVNVIALLPPNFVDEDGRVYLLRCPSCKMENYALAVSSGQCAWCGLKVLNNDRNVHECDATKLNSSNTADNQK